MEDVEDPDCVSMAQRLVRAPVKVSDTTAADTIMTSYAGGAAAGDGKTPVLCLHGFDSSCLEFRRLLPKLEEGGAEAYAIDVLGWGFTQRDEGLVKDFGVEGKRDHLKGFIEQVLGGRRTVLVGASLGGCVAIDFALQYPDLVEKLVLLDPQGYVEGAPMGGQPKFLQDIGIGVLKSKPLRMFANKIAYADPDTFGTEDAMRIGRLHCLSPPGWEEAMRGYMDGGGYKLASSIARVPQSTLILWGDQDKILDPSLYADRFVEDLGSEKAKLEMVENCGHVPHLEQSQMTCDKILEYLGMTVSARV